jgi:hypothetical protein
MLSGLINCPFLFTTLPVLAAATTNQSALLETQEFAAHPHIEPPFLHLHSYEYQLRSELQNQILF